jgi:hypothetical protein
MRELAGRYERASQESESITNKRKTRLHVTSDQLEQVLLQKQDQHFKGSAVQGRMAGFNEGVTKGRLLIKRKNTGSVCLHILAMTMYNS